MAVSLTLASTDQREVHKMYFRKRNPLKNLRGSLYPIGVDQRRKCEKISNVFMPKMIRYKKNQANIV